MHQVKQSIHLVAVAVAAMTFGASISNASTHAISYSAAGNSMKLNLAGLDLNTETGQKAATERLHDAARKLCDSVKEDLDMSKQTNFVACVQSVMDKGQVTITQFAAHQKALNATRQANN